MKLYTSLIALFVVATVFSQETTVNQEPPNTLENQFKTLYRRSTTYQEYKVMSKEKYLELQQNVSDSIQSLHKIVNEKNALINSQTKSMDSLQKAYKTSTADLRLAKTKADSISFFGAALTKTSYNLIFIGIIILLAAGLFYFLYKFKNSNVVTQKALYDLEDVEHEFNAFRKKSLEREQKIRRQLQDEIIKNRGN